MKFKSSDLKQTDFREMNLNEDLMAMVKNMGVQSPTEIQMRAIPVCMQEADAIVVGQTGSGKTLAYVLPILTMIKANQEQRALILVPSREVAQQVHKVLLDLTKDSDLKVALVVAGTPNKEQVSLLKKNPNVIVATPGRMNEHLVTNKLLLQKTAFVVIDEADRMLDLGFSAQLDNIKKTMRGKWATWMFSASFGPSVQKVADKFVTDQAYLVRTENSEKPVAELRQKVFHLDRGMKNDLLAKELKSVKGGVIVFVANQPTCEEVGNHLKNNGFSADFIHGELSHGHRNRVLRDFREQKIQIMITTDLLARGLDVLHIDCVVNYDLPSEAEDFLHRIGRTARAGRKGKALTFVSARDKQMFEKIKKYLDNAEEVRL